MKVFLQLICCTVGAVLLVACSGKPSRDTGENATGKRLPYSQGAVNSINADKMEVEVLTGVTGMHDSFVFNIFRVTPETVIVRNGKQALFEDIKESKFLRIRYAKDGENRIARWINVIDKIPDITHFKASGIITAVDMDLRTLEVKTKEGPKKTYAMGDDLMVGIAEFEVGKFVRITGITDESGILIARKTLVHDDDPAKRKAGPAPSTPSPQ